MSMSMKTSLPTEWGRASARPAIFWAAGLSAAVLISFRLSPLLTHTLLASNFLPHLYCYLGRAGLLWTHVIADCLIGLSYVAISGTLAYLARKGRHDIPFNWMFVAFGLFIIACGGSHFMEAVTVWIPVYVLSASVKVFTALVSATTAVLLPFTVPRILALVQIAKKSEAAEAKFHQIADNIQEIFWMVNAETKEAIYVNAAFEKLTGRTRTSLWEDPLSYRDIIHPDDRQLVLTRLDEARGTATFDEEFRINRPDGTVRWVGARGFPIRDAQGVTYRLAGVVQDISERKWYDEAIRRLAAIVESSDDAIISKDLTGTITSWNRAAERIFGYSKSEAIGQPITIIIPRELVDEEFQILLRLQADEHIQHYETVRVTKQGNRIDVSLTISPMKDSTGRIYGVSKIARDISERKRMDETLRFRETEARSRAEELAAFLDAIPGMALIARDASCREITGSRAAYEMLRLPYGSNISKSAENIKQPSTFRVFSGAQEIPASELPIQKAAATGQQIRESEITLVFEDGTSREMLGNAAPLIGPDGTVRGAIGVFIDITERTRAAEALRESENRYRDLIEHSQDLVCTHNLEGKLLSVNPAPARILGYEVAELLDVPMQDIIAPEYREQFDAYLARIKTVGADGGVMAVVTRTGERRFWEYHNTLRTEGVPFPIVRGMAHDVTERRLAEKSLRMFRMLVDESNDAIEVADPHSLRFIDINGRACKDLGYTREELLSMKIFDIDPNIDESLYSKMIGELQSSGFTIFESLHRRKDGSTFPVEVSMKYVHLDRVYIVMVARDVTKRKLAEQALQESQSALARVSRISSMGELTATIAHEINQPLAALATNASASLHWLAAQPPNLKEARKALASTIRDATRASDVIVRIRALLNKTPPRMLPLDVNELIREVLALVRSQLTTAGVVVRTSIASNLPNVRGDRVELQQVMMNLLMNAIEAMVDVNDRPRALLVKSSKHPDGVLVQVSDSGCGLDPQHSDCIFDPFFTTKTQGIGMGLAISRAIIESHGGRISGRQRSPHGAVFQFTLRPEGS